MTLLEDLTKQMIEELDRKREAIINQRIVERTNVKDYLGILNESQRTFPRIKVIADSLHQTQKVYWNDGREKGLLLVEFFYKYEINYENPSATMQFQYM